MVEFKIAKTEYSVEGYYEDKSSLSGIWAMIGALPFPTEEAAMQRLWELRRLHLNAKKFRLKRVEMAFKYLDEPAPTE
jgi:hypothetical protein